MIIRIIALLAIAFVGTTALAGCANTIRGAGRDAANVVDATQDAGHSVRRSARHKHY